MFALMKRITSVVRQLAERQARLQSEVARLEETAAALLTRATKVRAELEAVTTLLPSFDARVDPSQIEPIAAQGRHGRRGSFLRGLRETLTAFGTEWVDTTHLALLLRHRFNLSFHDYESERAWVLNVVRPALRKLVASGEAERFKAGPNHSDRVFWRLALPASELSLGDLRAQAEADGLAVAV